MTRHARTTGGRSARTTTPAPARRGAGARMATTAARATAVSHTTTPPPVPRKAVVASELRAARRPEPVRAPGRPAGTRWSGGRATFLVHRRAAAVAAVLGCARRGCVAYLCVGETFVRARRGGEGAPRAALPRRAGRGHAADPRMVVGLLVGRRVRRGRRAHPDRRPQPARQPRHHRHQPGRERADGRRDDVRRHLVHRPALPLRRSAASRPRPSCTSSRGAAACTPPASSSSASASPSPCAR